MNIYDKKVYWRCKRGMLELDFLLLKFYKNFYFDLNLKSKKLFFQMLSYSDQELYDLLLSNKLSTDYTLQDIIFFIRYFGSNFS